MAKKVKQIAVDGDGVITKVPYVNKIWEHFSGRFIDGRRVMDDTPVELPSGYQAPLTLEQKMARIMRDQRILANLEAAGLESFDEADDFDVGDNDDDDYEWENDPDMSIVAAAEANAIAPIKARGVSEIVSSVKSRLAKTTQTKPASKVKDDTSAVVSPEEGRPDEDKE